MPPNPRSHYYPPPRRLTRLTSPSCPLAPFAAPPPQVHRVYPEDHHVYTKVRPLMLDLHMSFLLSLAYPCSPVLLPLFYCPSGPLHPRPRFSCATKTLMSTLTTEHFRPRRLYLRPRPLYLHRSHYVYKFISTAARLSGNFDFRVFIVFLGLRLTLAASTLVVSFRSTHHSVPIAYACG